jgi:hypothetical protein
MSIEDPTSESPVISELRKQVKAYKAQAEADRETARGYVMKDAFAQYGIEPDSGTARLAQQGYDGDLSPEAVSTWMSDMGFTPTDAPASQEQPDGLQQRVEQRQNLDKIEADGTPSGPKKMSLDDHKKLARENPQAALAAWQNGSVESHGASLAS